jgi:Flp pilus assembly protein TadD
MSLINQMLRDLENRNTTNDAPSTLQDNIRVTQLPASKMSLLIWSLLAFIAIGGTYWAYRYSKTLAKAKTPPAIVVDNIKKVPIPNSPYEKVLAAPNAVNDTAPKAEQKPPENTTTQPVPVAQPVAVQPVSAVQTAPAVQALVPAVEPKPPAQSVQTEPKVVAATSPVKKPIAPKPAPIKETSVKQQADLLYRKVENNYEDYSAVDKLEQVLQLDPRHLKARLLLAKTLHNQGRVNKTAEFLDQSLDLFPDNLQFINTRAQLFLQQKDPNGALKTLQRVDLTNSTNETHLSLLAATYQQLQSFANAAKVYQRLVTVNPEKAENWLGFALAQEKLGNPKLAREAYQQALSKNTLKESIVSYIKQRLMELR